MIRLGWSRRFLRQSKLFGHLFKASFFYAQHLELVDFDRAKDGVGTPSLDRIQVEIKVSFPYAAKDALAFLTGTKRHAQSAISDARVINT